MSDQAERMTTPIDTTDLQNKPPQTFNEWMASSKRRQIRSVTVLTGLLYILSAQLDYLIAPKEILPLMIIVHLYLLPPLLFLISLLTFVRRLWNLAIVLLVLAPIGAAIGNLFIVYPLEHPSMRLTEIYLIIFWIFTVSGLRLWQATISAFTTFLIGFLATYFYFSLSLEYFLMHCFWMGSALSFGFLAAYLMERTSKTVFLHQMQLEQLAVTDKLTGLYNRSKLDELLLDEIYRSHRYKSTFGIVLMDFDFFKNINDKYGHQVGDEALIEIAKLITGHLRTTDKAVRWGGEEFIIVYLNTDRQEIIQLAEELRRKIEQHVFKSVGPQTASLGVTIYHDGDTMDTIIQRADKALYRAKEMGRNRIEFI